MTRVAHSTRPAPLRRRIPRKHPDLRRGSSSRKLGDGQAFIRFTQESLSLTTLEDLAASARRFLTEALPVSDVDLLVPDEQPGIYRSLSRPGLQVRFTPRQLQRSFREVKAHPLPRPLEALLVRQTASLAHFRGGYLLPLPSKHGLLGLLLIGPPRSRKDLTAGDKAFCAIVANGLSVAATRIQLAEKLRAEEVRTAKIEKLAALGRLTAGIAHEFRNPLNIISTSAQTLLRNPEDLPLHREIAKYILDEAGRLSRTVDEFLQFAKPHTPVWEPTRIEQVFDSVLQALRPRAMEAGIRVTQELEPELPEITTSPQHLQRTLVNLGLNGIEAMTRDGSLSLSARPGDRGTIRIDVRDTGHGISPEHSARLFDPFFTTKPDGTGLGLPIVFMLIQTIKGKITFSTGSGGTTFHIDLPVDGSRS